MKKKIALVVVGAVKIDTGPTELRYTLFKDFQKPDESLASRPHVVMEFKGRDLESLLECFTCTYQQEVRLLPAVTRSLMEKSYRLKPPLYAVPKIAQLNVTLLDETDEYVMCAVHSSRTHTEEEAAIDRYRVDGIPNYGSPWLSYEADTVRKVFHNPDELGPEGSKRKKASDLFDAVDKAVQEKLAWMLA